VNTFFEYITLGFIVLLGAMSPGPDFVLVTKNSLSGSRRLGMITGLGVAAALLVHITYASLGMAFVLHESKLFYYIVRSLGSSYLCYLGVRMIMGRKKTFQEAQQPTGKLTEKKAFISGFLCNLLNVKASLFIIGIFTQIVGPHITLPTLILTATEIVSITFLWFALLSVILTHEAIKAFFLRYQPHINGTLGVLLIGFAFKMIFT
jgi:RhtB (resistance to homoserine/threonine) family protein